MNDQTPRTGMLRELFATLPPTARTILMWMLLFPIAVAISGMLLQVNVGALIQDSLKQSRGQTVDIVNQMLKAQLDRMDDQLTDVQRSLLAHSQNYGVLDKRLTLVERDIEYIKRRGEGLKQ